MADSNHHLTIGTSSLSLGLSTISALWNLSNSNDPASTMITPSKYKTEVKGQISFTITMQAYW